MVGRAHPTIRRYEGSERRLGAWPCGDGAGRVAEDDVAVAGRGCGGCPAAGEAGVEEFVRAWRMVPDGDRRHDAESADVVGDDEPVVPAEEDVVAELVLGDH